MNEPPLKKNLVVAGISSDDMLCFFYPQTFRKEWLLEKHDMVTPKIGSDGFVTKGKYRRQIGPVNILFWYYYSCSTERMRRIFELEGAKWNYRVKAHDDQTFAWFSGDETRFIEDIALLKLSL